MPVTMVPVRSSVQIALNAGTNTDTGRMITKNCNVRVAPSADVEKVKTVADLIVSVLAHPAVRIRRTEICDLE